MKRIQSRKRHFQLLELMVAAFILLVCIAPTMRIFTSMYQAQQEIIRENQRDHLAHLVHAKITEMLYKRQLHIPKGDNHPPAPLPPEVNDELKKFSYSCEAELVILKGYTPKGQEHPVKYLAQLVITLKDVSPKVHKKEKIFENRNPSKTFYDYLIYIDAGKKASQSEGKKTDEGKRTDGDDEEGEDEDDEQDDDEQENDRKKKTSPNRPQSPLKDTKKKN